MDFKSAIIRFSAIIVAAVIQSEVLAAAEIRVVSTPGVSALMRDIVPEFERTTGHKLAIRYGLNPFQQQQITAGDFDIAIVQTFILDEGIQNGKITADSRTPLSRLQLAVGVKAGAAKLDVSSIASLKQRAKTKPQDSVAQVWQAVAKGAAELDFGFASNILGAPGVEVAGAFPSELQHVVVMMAGIGVASQDVGASREFIRYLKSPQVTALMKPKGLEPVSQ